MLPGPGPAADANGAPGVDASGELEAFSLDLAQASSSQSRVTGKSRAARFASKQGTVLYMSTVHESLPNAVLHCYCMV